MTGESDGTGDGAEPDRIGAIDWETVDADDGGVPRRPAAVLAAVLGIAAAVGYEAVRSGGGPTVAWPVAYRVTPLDGLFVATLVVGVAYGAYPLYADPRLARRYWARFREHRVAVWCLWVLAGVCAVGVLGPLVVAKPTVEVAVGYQPPAFWSVPATIPGSCVGPVVDGACRGTWQYPLGTTGDGRGILASVIYGTRVSLQVGLITATIVVLVGTTVGTVAAAAGGRVDEALMRYVDVQMTFPAFFLYLFVLYLFGGSLVLLILVFGFTSWGGTARLVRSETLQRREEGYVRAARAAGASTGWLLRRHLVPNVSGTVITNATLLVPGLILLEASFAFLGLGDPGVTSWGEVIAAGRGDLATAWWISTIPGVALFVTVLALNFVGDALRDALDPRVASGARGGAGDRKGSDTAERVDGSEPR